ncbi:MAG: hypothetical protein M3Y85_08600 [Bacteroidota bacterium]|nr:hypothetical protein [Bacteroidota bacterium]
MKKDKTKKDNAVQERIANIIVSKCIVMQKRWAVFMQESLERLSVNGKKYVLICYCVLFGGFSIYLIGENVRGSNKKLFTVTSIKAPSHLLETGEPKKKLFGVSALIPDLEYKKIQRFKNYMDSLVKTKKGKILFDSILRSRPKLLDSVIQIETIYKNQKK